MALCSTAQGAHPDRHGGSEEAFRKVGEAHAVLSDAARRRAWDAGEDLSPRHQSFPLKDELARFYFPELAGFRPFGDPFERKPAADAARRRGG